MKKNSVTRSGKFISIINELSRIKGDNKRREHFRTAHPEAAKDPALRTEVMAWIAREKTKRAGAVKRGKAYGKAVTTRKVNAAAVAWVKSEAVAHGLPVPDGDRFSFVDYDQEKAARLETASHDQAYAELRRNMPAYFGMDPALIEVAHNNAVCNLLIMVLAGQLLPTRARYLVQRLDKSREYCLNNK